jgi:hypothetical protein
MSLDDNRVESLRSGIDGSSQPGGTSPDDEEVVQLLDRTSVQTDPLGKLGTQLSKRLSTVRRRRFQTAAVWDQEQRQAPSLKSTRPKKVNQRIPLNVDPPRTNEVAGEKIPVPGYMRRRAATDQIDTTLVVGFVARAQIAEGYHITSIKLLPFRRQLRDGTCHKQQPSRAGKPG